MRKRSRVVRVVFEVSAFPDWYSEDIHESTLLDYLEPIAHEQHGTRQLLVQVRSVEGAGEDVSVSYNVHGEEVERVPVDMAAPLVHVLAHTANPFQPLEMRVKMSPQALSFFLTLAGGTIADIAKERLGLAAIGERDAFLERDETLLREMIAGFAGVPARPAVRFD